MKTNQKLILLDSNSLINRAFYALPPLMTNEGLYTNGILGFVSMLQKLIAEQKPTHIGAVFDCRAKTFRHAKYEAYKANRKPMSQELAMQIPILQELLELMGIKILFKEGVEGDDIIGTLSKRFSIPTIIVSGDRDTLQLVDESTTVFSTRRGVSDVKVYTPTTLNEEGFTPAKIIEFKGLAGDSSDNIPGALGVGVKTATRLLDDYGSIDGVYSHIDQIKGKLKDRLLDSKSLVYLSKDLATIETKVELECSIDDLKFDYPLPQSARDFMKRLEFTNLVKRFDYHGSSGDNSDNASIAVDIESIDIADKNQLYKQIGLIPKGSKVCVIWQDSITVAYDNKELNISVSNDLFGTGITDYEVAEIISPLFSSEYTNIFFDAKQNFYTLKNFDIMPSMPYEDVLLKAYLINPNKVIKSATQVCTDYGLSESNLSAQLLALDDILDKILAQKELNELYRNIELPLIECLYNMEQEGFKLDMKVLEELDAQYTAQISDLVKEIHHIAGEEFNVNSNKQLSEILFNKLGLTHGKKTKTGFSVSAEVLEEIEHPIINSLLRYRTLTKLKSTYIDGMRSVMNKATNKVHTVFNQCLTATGRLSSTEPNLQNIPIRTQEGREIRRMFIPTQGVLISADYSQIELRLLAHFSQDEHLVNAYRNNIDVHKLTASKIFNVPLQSVDEDMRASAKAVNFGIIYGISSFGLAKNAKVGNYQAKIFIDEYFNEYPAVKKYIDANVRLATKQGYLRTLMGRIRHFPELASPKYNIKEFGKRAAMNMPLQGSASDIIKVAMLKVSKALKQHNLKAKLILQVHDELILDVPLEEKELVKTLLCQSMENAVELGVPLTVSVSTGKNWYEAN